MVDPGGKKNVALKKKCRLYWVYYDWGEWNACDKTCETGTKIRLRNCTIGDVALCQNITSQSDIETATCNTELCPSIFQFYFTLTLLKISLYAIWFCVI